MRNRSLRQLAALAGKLFAIGAILTAAACRQDMHNQPRYKPFAQSDFFQDGRSERPRLEGTVPRGYLRYDQARYTGKVNGTEITAFPFQITKDDLLRGQQRFNIYCSPCHSRTGDGLGQVVRRGFRQPPSYYSPKLVNAPVGHFFDVMTNGFGAMPSYASRVAPDDRWRITAYIRALQLSATATAADVPGEQRNNIQPPVQPLGGLQPTINAPPANPAEPTPAAPSAPSEGGAKK